MNLILHGIDNPDFRYNDTLAKSFTESNMYDVILANPPFKGSIDKSDISERFKVKTSKTELLYLELIYHMLVTGGRCGVIVPDGVLFGSSNAHKDVRKMLTENCRLEGVISMPSGVFKPYAGVSTAVLIFRKGEPTERVWFYDMQADGFSLNDQRDKISDNDIPDILAKWNSRKSVKGNGDRKDKSFYVPVEEIKENGYDLSINRYKETQHEDIQYDNPKSILKRVESLEKSIV
jgi:type I restriction enzyme M protein